ncbi:MAG: response regulator transcription factor [Chitinophagaceae bacterium]|nr:MAG: response regulator transcription factor [Chitinophagaceae bacterium]
MSNPVKILLVEDELIIADYMNECLKHLGYEVCATAISYEEAVKAVCTCDPDIAIVDITLKGGRNGIDFGRYLKEKHRIPFIFATSHSDRCTIDAAKQVLPYAYLIKPFSEEDLYAVIETALMQFGRKTQRDESEEDPVIIHDGIFIRHKGRFTKVALADIRYIEANDNYATIVTVGQAFVLKTTLKNLQDALPDYFWRIHRSYIVNLHHLESLDTEDAWIGKKQLPIGKSFYPLLIERLKIVQG